MYSPVNKQIRDGASQNSLARPFQDLQLGTVDSEHPASRVDPDQPHGRIFEKLGQRLLALALMAVAAIPASAADIALVIDNQSLNSSQATALSDGLEAAGYDVISRDGSRADLAEAFSDAAGRIDGEGRLMLLWFGETRASGNETWLLPEDFDGSTVVDAEFGAISLSC